MRIDFRFNLNVKMVHGDVEVVEAKSQREEAHGVAENAANYFIQVS